MDDGQNESAVRRYWTHLWSEGNFDIAASFYADPFRYNGEPITPIVFGRDGARFRNHFSDFTVTLDFLTSCADLVVDRVTLRGMHVADFKAVPARGRKIEVTAIDIFRFSDGQVVEHWHETDHLTLYQQMGAEVRAVSE